MIQVKHKWIWVTNKSIYIYVYEIDLVRVPGIQPFDSSIKWVMPTNLWHDVHMIRLNHSYIYCSSMSIFLTSMYTLIKVSMLLKDYSGHNWTIGPKFYLNELINIRHVCWRLNGSSHVFSLIITSVYIERASPICNNLRQISARVDRWSTLY